MSFRSSQRLAWWSALAALVLGGAGCGNDTPDVGTAPPTQTTVSFSAPEHFGVNDARETGGPRVAVGQGKTWVALWGSSSGIVAERSIDGGAHWSVPIVVAAGGQGFAPDLACDRNGVCVAVWKEVNVDTGEHDVFAARSPDDGATWDASVLLGRKDVFEAFNSEPVVATGRDGEWVIVWDALDAPDGVLVGDSSRLEAVRSRDGAFTWEAPSVVDATDHELRFVPRIAADEDGNYLVIFSSIDDDELSAGRTRLFAVRSSDGREWSAAVAVDADDPRATMRESPGDVAVDGDGTWHIVFTVQRPDLEQGGFFIEVLAARSVDGGATWTLQQLDEPGASTVELFATLAADADGHVVAVWLTSLEANAFQLLTAQSADGGKTWSAPSDFPGGAANPLFDGFPDVDLAADGAGAWAAVWLLAAPGAQPGFPVRDVVVAQGATR